MQSDFICFRRFNGTHQFGCQSKLGGSVGTVHVVRNELDIDLIVKDGKNAPYIPCLRTQFFTRENLLKFQNSERVAGLVLFDLQFKDKLPSAFSEDKQCPNEMTSYYKDSKEYGFCKWNSYAPSPSIAELNLDFPMMLMRDEKNITSIEQCFNDFNQLEKRKTIDLLCSLELKTWMYGAKSSKVCMSRSSSDYNLETVLFCDSINSFNVFDTQFKYANATSKIDDRSILMLISRIDALSIFDNAANGVSTTFTSLITLFSVMKILKQQQPTRKNGRNVMYSLFDGEAFDYIGSGRTAYDLGTPAVGLQSISSKNKLKFLKQHLHSAIEISQATFQDKFYIHTDPLTRAQPNIESELTKLINSLQTNSKILEKVDYKLKQPLPPSSVQQLLAHDHNLPVLVISNHKTEYVNKFYNSFLDDKRTIDDRKEQVIENIASLSESIASTLISFLNDGGEASKIAVKADLKLIKQLYDCFIEDSRCKFFEQIRGKPSNLRNYNYPLYISTSGIEEIQPYHSEYIMTLKRLSAFLNGDRLSEIISEENCKALGKLNLNLTYEWFNISAEEDGNETTFCIESTVFQTLARSPVFLLDKDQLQPNWSLNYSTWTESVWNTPSIRLFVSASKFQEYFTFFTGLTILLISFFISLWISKNASVLFIDLRLNNNVAVSM